MKPNTPHYPSRLLSFLVFLVAIVLTALSSSSADGLSPRKPAGRAQPAGGTAAQLTVHSIPAGVEIVLDGTPTGHLTPYTFEELDPGDHTVTVIAPEAMDVPTTTVTLGSEPILLDFILSLNEPSRAFLRGEVDLDFIPACSLEFYYTIPEGFQQQNIRPVIISLHGSQPTDGNDDAARRATAEMQALWLAERPNEPGTFRNERLIAGEYTAFTVASIRWWYDTPCWENGPPREERYLNYQELARATLAVLDFMWRHGAQTDAVLLHGLSRGGERSWVVTWHINADPVFRSQYVEPWEEETGEHLEITLAFPHGGACEAPCIQEILQGGGNLSRCRFFPYAGNADHVEYATVPGCSADTNPNHLPNYYKCPWRIDALVESWETLLEAGVSTAMPKLGERCLADGVGDDQIPKYWGDETTRVYPGCPPYPLQEPDHCAHEEVDDNALDELFNLFAECITSGCNPGEITHQLPSCDK